MMTVNDVSKMTGVSIRTLQYYDNIGLLKPRDVLIRDTGCMTIRHSKGYSRFYCSGNWNFH